MAVTTVRPSASAKIWNVSTTGAVAVHTVTSDNNDATVVTGVVNRAYAWLDIPSVTVSSTVRVVSATIRVRASSDGADPTRSEQVYFHLRDPSSGLGTANTVLGLKSATVAAYTSAKILVPAIVGGDNSWTQAAVDRQQVSLNWIESNGGGFGRFAEVFVDWETNTQPTVSAVTASGYDISTRPTVAFTYADTEGDPQVAYEAKAFTAAQYGAAGFDAATSTSTWDSGEVFSAAGDFTVGADLANGVTHKIYVKAGQRFAYPQGLGGTWYSTWVASAAFTIAVTTPPTPTIAVTQELSPPRYANRVVVSLTGLNLLSADSASAESSVGDWVNDSNTTLTTSATNPKSGLAALQLTAIAAANMVIRSGSSATAKRVTPGATYSATNSFRAATTGRTCSTGIRWLDVAGAAIGADVYGTGVADSNAGYTTPVLSGATAPANAFSALVLAKVASAGLGEVHRVDESALIVGTTTTWTAGGYVTGGTVVVEAVQRISDTITRGPTPSLMHPQLASGGALTTLTDGFYARVATDSVVFRQLDRVPPEAPTNTTAGMIEWQIRTGVSAYLDVGAQDGVATDGMHPYLIPVVPGRAITCSMWLWASATITVRLVLYTTDNVNTAIGLDFGSTVVLTTSPQKVTVSGTPAANCVWARVAVEDNSSTANVSVFVTQPRARATVDADENWPGQVFAFTRYVVRNGEQAIPTNGSTTVTVVDHEAPPGRYVLYTAYTSGLTTTGATMASARSTPVPLYMALPAKALLKDPFQPENALQCRIMVADHRLSQDEDAGTFHPLGGDGDPVVWRDWLSGKNGRISVFAKGNLERYRLDQLHPSARPLLVQWAEGGGTYIRVVGRSFAPIQLPNGYWRADFDYVETRRP
jgi:hypothetical protein